MGKKSFNEFKIDIKITEMLLTFFKGNCLLQ